LAQVQVTSGVAGQAASMLLAALIVKIIAGIVIWTAVTASLPRWPVGPDHHRDRDMRRR
jgi:hypothetical protein